MRPATTRSQRPISSSAQGNCNDVGAVGISSATPNRSVPAAKMSEEASSSLSPPPPLILRPATRGGSTNRAAGLTQELAMKRTVASSEGTTSIGRPSTSAMRTVVSAGAQRIRSDAELANTNNGLCMPAERWPTTLQERAPRGPTDEEHRHQEQRQTNSRTLPTRNDEKRRSRERTVDGPFNSSGPEGDYFRLVPVVLEASSEQTQFVSRYLDGLMDEVRADHVVKRLISSTKENEKGGRGEELTTTCADMIVLEPTAAWRIESSAVDSMREWRGLVVKKVRPLCVRSKGDDTILSEGEEAALSSTGGRLSYLFHTQALVPQLRGFYFFNVFKDHNGASASSTGGGGAALASGDQKADGHSFLDSVRRGIGEALAELNTNMSKGEGNTSSGQARDRSVDDGDYRLEEVAVGRVLLCCVRVGRVAMNQPQVVDRLQAEAELADAEAKACSLFSRQQLQHQRNNTSTSSYDTRCARLSEVLSREFNSDSIMASVSGGTTRGGPPATLVFSSEAVAPTHVIEFRCFVKVPCRSKNNTCASSSDMNVGLSKEDTSLLPHHRRPATAGVFPLQRRIIGSSSVLSSSADHPLSPESAAQAVRQQMALISGQVRQQFKGVMDATAAKRDAVLMMLQQEEERLVRAARGGSAALSSSSSSFQPMLSTVDGIREHIASMRVSTAVVLREINKIFIQNLTAPVTHTEVSGGQHSGSGQRAQIGPGTNSGGGEGRAGALPSRPLTAGLLSPSQRRALGIKGEDDDEDGLLDHRCLSYDEEPRRGGDSGHERTLAPHQFVVNSPPTTAMPTASSDDLRALSSSQSRGGGSAATAAAKPVISLPLAQKKPPRPSQQQQALGTDVMVTAAQRGSSGPRQLMTVGIPRPSTSGSQRTYGVF